MRNRNFKWGIIGCGNIVEKFIKSLQQLPDTELMAVASKSAERASLFAKKFNVPLWYNNYGELVRNPDIDAVYVATTHNYHFENSKLCLEHGKPVLCEKPFTVNAQETAKLIELSRKNGVFLMEAFWTRFLPSTRKLVELLDQGVLGDVRLVKADFCYDWPFDPESRVYNPALAGGALLDVGVYPINFAQMIFHSDPVEIQSVASISKTGIDEQSAYLFRYKDGEMAVMHAAVNTETRHDAWIHGTKGYIHLPRFYVADKFHVTLWQDTGKTYKIPFKATGYGYEAMEVMNCIAKGKPESEIMPLDESLKIMKIMDSMRHKWGMKYPADSMIIS